MPAPIKPGFPITQSSHGTSALRTRRPAIRTSHSMQNCSTPPINAESIASARSPSTTGRVPSRGIGCSLPDIGVSVCLHYPYSSTDLFASLSGCVSTDTPSRRESQVDAFSRLRDNVLTMPTKPSDKRLAVLGTGKLGSILLRAYLKQGLFPQKHVTATVRHEEKAAALARELGVNVTTNNRTAVKDADV